MLSTQSLDNDMRRPVRDDYEDWCVRDLDEDDDVMHVDDLEKACTTAKAKQLRIRKS